jgi:hypothetical protein
MSRTQVQTPGEAVSVLIQTAQLAQSRGILSLDDAVIVKSAIDFLSSMSPKQPEVELTTEEGPKA